MKMSTDASHQAAIDAGQEVNAIDWKCVSFCPVQVRVLQNLFFSFATKHFSIGAVVSAEVDHFSC